jgi:hypothetical protein
MCTGTGWATFPLQNLHGPPKCVWSFVRCATCTGTGARVRARCFVGNYQAAKKAAEEVGAMAVCNDKRMRCARSTRMYQVAVLHDV